MSLRFIFFNLLKVQILINYDERQCKVSRYLELRKYLKEKLAKTYFGQFDLFNMVLTQEFGVKSSRILSEGMTGYNAKVNYMFNSPTQISEGSMYIDVDRDVHGVSSFNGDKNSEKAYMMISGVMSSYMEHAIFEQMFNNPSVSTIKVMQQANK